MPAIATSMQIETGEQMIVGVNAFQEESKEQIEILRIERTAQRSAMRKAAQSPRPARSRAVTAALDAFGCAAAARGQHNALYTGCSACVRNSR